MKVTVTKEFGSPEEAAAWLRIFSPAPVEISTPLSPFTMIGPGLVESVLGTGKALPGTTPPVVTTDKKPRKPRNDAGKPRGPYKTNGGPAASEPGTAGDSASTVPAAPVSPTNAAAPAAGAQPESEKTAPAAAAPTLDDVRAALALINKTPGMGMPAVMLHLQDFNTNRASLLKPEQYAAFVASAKQKVADHEAAAARDKAK
jgi:hypothetical protein